MRFVDEATIRVAAGKGGNGCLSFRREAFIPRGGPDGGDGGAGGSVYLEAREGLATLVEFRYRRSFEAQSGRPGEGGQRTGRSGEDCVVPVPPGTVVRDVETGELLGELTRDGERLLVARGGAPGLGNTRFRSSTNRAPRRTTPGRPGEVRGLALELRLLADVGLLGVPNAGKSTLLRAVSAARPRVADYPFTTLHPQLGVVRLDALRSFVVADIPGLIEGSAQGAGLGTQFLRHLARTRLLLHVVDLAPLPGAPGAASQVRAVAAELAAFSAPLAALPRWLVANKVDLLTLAQRRARLSGLRRALRWEGPIHAISAATGEGCAALMEAVGSHLAKADA
jgi:GTPase